jgi:hypothetical protein
MKDAETNDEAVATAADLYLELGTVSSELHALAARLTRLKHSARPAVTTLPKSWLQMETELISLRERVVSALHKERWSLRRIGDVIGTGPEAVRQYICRAEDQALLVAKREANAAKAAAMTEAEREALLAQSPRVLSVGVYAGHRLDQFESLRALCSLTVPDLLRVVGKRRVQQVCEALAELGLHLSGDGVGDEAEK